METRFLKVAIEILKPELHFKDFRVLRAAEMDPEDDDRVDRCYLVWSWLVRLAVDPGFIAGIAHDRDRLSRHLQFVRTAGEMAGQATLNAAVDGHDPLKFLREGYLRKPGPKELDEEPQPSWEPPPDPASFLRILSAAERFWDYINDKEPPAPKPPPPPRLLDPEDVPPTPEWMFAPEEPTDEGGGLNDGEPPEEDEAAERGDSKAPAEPGFPAIDTNKAEAEGDGVGSEPAGAPLGTSPFGAETVDPREVGVGSAAIADCSSGPLGDSKARNGVSTIESESSAAATTEARDPSNEAEGEASTCPGRRSLTYRQDLRPGDPGFDAAVEQLVQRLNESVPGTEAEIKRQLERYLKEENEKCEPQDTP